MKRQAGFSDCNSTEFDQIHVRRNGTLTERDLRHKVVQWVHCDGCQFRSARFASLKRYFGMRRAFVMLPEAMSASEDI
jgi:hypothetical protein